MKRLPLWCAVPGGVLAGHAVAYLVAYPHDAARASLLISTGHGYLRHAVLIAVLGGAVALTLAVARGAATMWRRASVLICSIQVVTFIGVELLERIASGAPVSGVSRIAVIGVLVQVAMGVLVALFLRLAHRAGRSIARAFAETIRNARETATTVSLALSALCTRWAAGALRPRAPPAPSR